MKYSLNGKWKFFVDEDDSGKEEEIYSLSWLNEKYESLEHITVPSNYNTKEGLDKYAGSVWYFITLPELPIQPKTYDYYIEFEGSNYITEAWINETKIGTHEGGFLPFRFRFSPRNFSLKFDNYLAVRVDASYFKDGVPSNNTDWFNWGGIHRNVYIVVEQKTRIEDVKIKTTLPTKKLSKSIISIDYKINNPTLYLEQCYIRQIPPQIEYEIYYMGRYFGGLQQFNPILIETGVQDVNPESTKLDKILHDKDALREFFADAIEGVDEAKRQEDLELFFKTQEGKGKTREEFEDGREEEKDGSAQQKQSRKKKFGLEDSAVKNTILVSMENPSIWTPETPELYRVKLILNGTEKENIYNFGIRQIEIRGTNVFLNHKPIKIKGASLHEELMPYGRHYPLEERRKDLIGMKNMGFNALRTAHYSHDESLIRLADEEGLLIFEEIHLYWDCEFGNRKTVKVALSMIRDLIKRDINHPSVIAWSVGNEVPTERRDCVQTIRMLMKAARKYDDTRLVTYVSNRYMGDTLRREADICCQNAYFGWYFATVYQLNFMLDVMYQTAPNKPWLITEFGAGAKYGVIDKNIKFSEENQARIISYQIQVLNSKPYMSGWFIWIYRDFRSHLRTNKYQQGFNRKGLVDEKNRKKLMARVMPQYVHRKLKKIRHYRGLAHMFALLLRWFERFFFRFFAPIGYKIQRKMNEKYYSSERT